MGKRQRNLSPSKIPPKIHQERRPKQLLKRDSIKPETHSSMRSHYSRLMLTNIKKELNSATNRCRTCSPIGLVTKQNMKSFYNGGTMTLENISCDRWKDCESFVNAKKEKEFVDRTQYITNHQFKKSSAPKNDLLPIHYIRNNRSKSPLQKVRHELSNNTQLEVTTVAKTTLIGEHRKNQIAPTNQPTKQRNVI